MASRSRLTFWVSGITATAALTVLAALPAAADRAKRPAPTPAPAPAPTRIPLPTQQPISCQNALCPALTSCIDTEQGPVCVPRSLLDEETIFLQKP